MSFFNAFVHSSQNSQQFSQELFTTQDLEKTEETYFKQKFFQTQFSQEKSQIIHSKGAFPAQFQREDKFLSSTLWELFSNDSIDSNEQSSEIDNTQNSSDDALFEQTFQDDFGKVINDTQTFNNFSKATQHPITSQIFSHQLISQATANSELTIKYDLKESIDRNIPRSVVNLFSEIKEHYSDWTFISILTGQLCRDKFPMGSYHSLKLALLMSLVTSSESPLHIMAIGSEMSNANKIMLELGELAERFVPVTNKTSDGIIIKKNGTREAGSLVMATQGISFVGYWQQLKPKIKTQLIREIETNTLLVQKAQKHVPLESTIWAHWNYMKKVKKDIVSLDQFFNVFGIPIIVDDKLYHKSIVHDLIDQLTVNPPNKFDGFDIPKEDMRAYLAIVKEQSTTFDIQAEVMLKNYFTATKAIRKNVLTEKSVEMLRKMSEAHAKLCLRSNVMRQDVLAAIGICERFVKTLFDTDAYSSPNEMKASSIEDFDKFQSKMFEWLSCFTQDILEKL